MGISLSLLFIAVGAILTFAVSATVSGASIPTIAIILMIVGAIGLVFSLIFWSSWGGFGGAASGGGGNSPQTTVIQDDRP